VVLSTLKETTGSMPISRRRFIESATILGLTGLGGCGSRDELAFPELEASGRAGDLGLAHGKAFAAQIRYNLEFYSQWLSLSGELPRTSR
jgi:hypothetical protein